MKVIRQSLLKSLKTRSLYHIIKSKSVERVWPGQLKLVGWML